jgi:hypothetical protein
MDDTEVVDAGTAETWSMIDHACRACGGRVLANAAGARVRCGDCSAEAEGSHESLCWCGALPAGFRARLRCVRDEHPTPASPGAIVAIECGENAALPPSAECLARSPLAPPLPVKRSLWRQKGQTRMS